MMIAPPGWECQPEEPPGCTVICTMATSVPNLSGIVPCEVLVPRANGVCSSLSGGVAQLGVTVAAVATDMTAPASPTLSSARRIIRFILLLQAVLALPTSDVGSGSGCLPRKGDAAAGG